MLGKRLIYASLVWEKREIFVQLGSFVSFLTSLSTPNKSACWYPPVCDSAADIPESPGLFYSGFGSPPHATNSLLHMLTRVYLFV